MFSPFVSASVRIVNIENIFDHFENILDNDLVAEQNLKKILRHCSQDSAKLIDKNAQHL